jgi:hypothetical protein
MVSFRSLPYRWFCCGLLLAALWLVPQSVLATKSTPKFFICPQGMSRDATILTESYQVNLCSKNMTTRTTPAQRNDCPTSSIPGYSNCTEEIREISIAAMRQRRTRQQMNLPVTTKDDIIYEAKGRNTLYRFDFNRRTLTIQPSKGQAKTEKILASD